MSGPAPAFTPQRRLSATFGPEVVAGLLSVAVIIAGGSFAVAAATGPTSSSTPAPTASASSAPGASSAPSAPTSPGPSAPSTLVPWAGEARSMVLTDARLIEVREHLQAELSGKPGRAREIARLLRAMNPTVTNALAIIDRLEAAGVTRALVDSLRAAHQGALDTSLDTLDAAIDNAPAYQQGAARVIEAFEDLESLSTRLAAEANLPSPSGEP